MDDIVVPGNMSASIMVPHNISAGASHPDRPPLCILQYSQADRVYGHAATRCKRSNRPLQKKPVVICE